MPEPSANTPAENTSAVPARPSRRAAWLKPWPATGLAIAVIAVVAVGVLWRGQGAAIEALSSQSTALVSELQSTGAALRRLEAELGGLDEQIAGLERTIAEREVEIERLRAESAELPVEIRALERRIEALQGGRIDAREIWLAAQAEYYLVLANTELTLAGHIGNAVEALELADSVLRSLGDPGLAEVRAAIDDELQALRSLPELDLERVVLALGNLSAQSAELTMRDQAPDNFGTADEAAADEAGLSRLWAQTREAVTSIVRVERQDGPVALQLTETERRIVRRQLALELQLARVAALEGRETDFRASLSQADAILEREFNGEARDVIAARELIAGLMPTELRPTLPDISDSLSLLRSAIGTR